MIIKPRIRGFICTTAHPAGLAASVNEQIGYVKSQPEVAADLNNALVIGQAARNLRTIDGERAEPDAR